MDCWPRQAEVTQVVVTQVVVTHLPGAGQQVRNVESGAGSRAAALVIMADLGRKVWYGALVTWSVAASLGQPSYTPH